MRRMLLALGLVLGTPTLLGAQVTIPNTFVSGTTASASQVNANFSALGTAALNRTGGTITGNITVDNGITIDGVDIGSVLGSGAITTGAATFTSTSAPQLRVRYDASNYLGVSVTSVGVVTLDAVGTGAAVTFSDVVTFSSAPVLSGASITAGTIPETALADGAVYARLAANETFSGTITFSSTPTFASGVITLSGTIPQAQLYQSDGGVNEKYWVWVTDGAVLNLTAYNDNLVGGSTPLTFTRSGSTVTGATLSATAITLTGTVGTIVGGTSSDPAAPQYTFAGDTDTGVYRAGANNVGIAAGGSSMAQFNSAGLITLAAITIPGTDNTLSLGSAGFRWSVVYAGTGTINTSDRRAKRDIKPTTLGIEFIDALKPVEYFWREGPHTGTKFYGFIAQDLQELGFEGIDKSNPNSLGLRYTELLAPLVKGLQEVHQEVHKLDQQNKFLNAKVDMLAKRIIELEKGNGERRAAEQ